MSDSTASSESHPAEGDAPRSARLALWSLLLGNLAIGTGFMLPIGLLHLIASSTSVTVSRAGTLMWAGSIVVAIGAPLIAWITSRFERRNLLWAPCCCMRLGMAFLRWPAVSRYSLPYAS